MRVLGIDPGSRFLGFGVVEERGGRARHVGHGVVQADLDAPLAERLAQLFEGLRAAIERYAPDQIAVEGVFHHKNARSALILGHARGVALLLAAQARLSVHEYAPARVKKAVGASGNASKDAVARMVGTLLQVDVAQTRADATDALAVALCHLSRARTAALVPSARPRRARTTGLEARLRPALVSFRPAHAEKPVLRAAPSLIRGEG